MADKQNHISQTQIQFSPLKIHSFRKIAWCLLPPSGHLHTLSLLSAGIFGLVTVNLADSSVKKQRRSRDRKQMNPSSTSCLEDDVL